METFQEYREKKLKKYYGASKRVYQQTHVKRLLRIQRDLLYLGELQTRTRLVPCNQTFRDDKAIPHYNITLEVMKLRYPNIKEFHQHRPIQEK